MAHRLADAELCAFPACGAAVKKAYALDMALCWRHRELLLDNPGEFRRLWDALDPRPEPLAAPHHIPDEPHASVPPVLGI